MAEPTTEIPFYDDKYEAKIIKEKKPHPPRSREDPLFEKLKKYLQEVVILLVTINDHEKWAALDHLDPPKADGNPLATKSIRWFDDATNTTVTLGMFADHKAALIQAKMGNDCRKGIENALNLMPNIQLLVAVGVAYGSKKYKYADILVSTTIDGVDNVKYDDGGKVIFREGDNRSTRMADRVIQAFAMETGAWAVETGFKCCSNKERQPNVVTGLLISAPWLVNDEKYLSKLFDNDPEARGGEMEGLVIASISNNLRSPPTRREVDVVIIKGVADFADGNKQEGKKWQLTAAMAAASYTKYMLKETGGTVYKLAPSTNTSGQQGPVNSGGAPIQPGKMFEHDDFNSVTTDLWSVRDDYPILGSLLGLSQADIGSIRSSNMGKVSDCFYEVIRKCIDRGLSPGDIIKALESTQLNKMELAKKFREKYKS